ncbi:TorF family putative porin [Thioalkalivibrio paradoxus]|uniref:Outer membrane protein beta-barrel domain-containing protein n=1 Tax=Thioalkalivibrio paradoxus ARh 1 TaxID=713585 RepID=W0DGL5_9GAMM|nr:TorF family putative porin [Thioalkalivibrio paradoxus]AHE97769.1 hypothetical protein THITH_05300 [Thioalkalivibrio paradoxus ARh 1]
MTTKTHSKKTIRFLSLSMTTLALGLAAPVAVQADLEFHVGVFSDYIDNGESKSDNNAVVQGGLEYSHESGLFAGVAMSTLGSGEGQEVVPFIGYGFGLGELGFELGYEYFYYTEGDDRYEGEIFAGVEYGPFYAETSHIVRAHDRDTEGDTVYLVGASDEFMTDTFFDVALGYDRPRNDDNATFWSLGVGRSLGVGEISLTYASRNESDAQNLFVAGYTVSF